MLAEHGTLMFNGGSEMSILMDGLIYEEQVQQRKIGASFLAGYICRDEIDRRLAEAMRTARLGVDFLDGGMNLGLLQYPGQVAQYLGQGGNGSLVHRYGNGG